MFGNFYHIRMFPTVLSLKTERSSGIRKAFIIFNTFQDKEFNRKDYSNVQKKFHSNLNCITCYNVNENAPREKTKVHTENLREKDTGVEFFSHFCKV